MLMRQKQNRPQTNEKRKTKRGNQTNLLSITINFFSPWTMQTKMIQQRKKKQQNKSPDAKQIQGNKKPPNCSNRIVKKKKRKRLIQMFHAILERKNHVANHPYDCQFPLFVPVTKRQQKEKKKKKKFIYLSFKVSEINGHILKKNMLHMRPLLYNANGISPKRRKEISKDSSAECGFS